MTDQEYEKEKAAQDSALRWLIAIAGAVGIIGGLVLAYFGAS